MEQGGKKGKAAAPASSSRLPERQQPKKCPRCESTNTKFCYFNNYSSSQPRHFCKACRRYWTEGGTLRNVPQGGSSTGHRRNKRPRRSSSSSASLSSSSSASTSSTTNNHRHSRLLLAHSSPAEVGVDPLLMPPPPPPPPQSFFYGGGLGLPPFHPGNGGGVIGGDLTGFPAAVAEEMAPPPPPQGNPLLLPGFGFPLVEQQLLAPFDGTGLVVHHPRASLAFSQQMIHATVFSTTTAGPATTAAAAGSDRGEPFWVSSFGGGSGDGSSRWGADNPFDRGSGPRPPPSSFI